MISGYGDVHDALRRQFGSAVGRPCVVPGCRRLADGWGLVGEATNYGEKKDGTRVRWSTDLKDYAPLCYSHNAQLDRGGDLLMCPRGHVRITWGKDPHNSECVGCRRERLREYKRRRRTDPAFRDRENAKARERRARRRAIDHRAGSAALPRDREQHDTGQQATTRGTTP